MEGVIYGNMDTDQWLGGLSYPQAPLTAYKVSGRGGECWRSYEGGQMCYELQGSAHGMPSVGLSQD